MSKESFFSQLKRGGVKREKKRGGRVLFEKTAGFISAGKTRENVYNISLERKKKKEFWRKGRESIVFS